MDDAEASARVRAHWAAVRRGDYQAAHDALFANRAPRVWMRCETHDVRYLTRSPESLRHGCAECVVVESSERREHDE